MEVVGMTYRVKITVPYVYVVEAESESEAREIALGKYFNDSLELPSQIPEITISEKKVRS
jgi:hypothetical protein